MPIALAAKCGDLIDKAILVGLLGFLIAVSNPASAQTGTACPPASEPPTPEMIRSAARDARDHGFMWRISKNGHTSYLYGTMHVGKLEWVYPGPKVIQALSATDTVALELDDLDADIQMRMAKGLAEASDMVLPEALVNRLRQQAVTLCVPYASIARTSPELQVELLSLMVGRLDKLDAAYASDAVLAAIGHDTKKNVVSLETPELQLDLLKMKTPRETVSFVHISEVWANADYAAMSHFSDWCGCLDTGIEREMMKRMLDERNPSMAEHIDALHAGGKHVFAAVGSLHMFGEIGLPALMKRRGYLVEQVDLKPQ